MSFTDKQRRSLTAKLKHQRVKTRSVPGGKISYVEGWHVIAEANRIFGHDSWDRMTLSPQCVWSESQKNQSVAFYTTKVRITVRAGGDVIMREGIGTGFGRAPSAEAAHEIALKAAETDATKRALATFGNPFGLALYDKDQAGVTRPLPPPLPASTYFVLCRDGEGETSFQTPTAFADAAFATIRTIKSIDALYAFWERNRASLAQLKSAVPEGAMFVDAIIAALKDRARALRHTTPTENNKSRAQEVPDSQGSLAFPKEKRIRNKEHLKLVAQQACLVCGRRPTHAHHVRFAQRRGLGTKVSDEFTVPLCSVHHDAVHRTGDERRWWARQAIDPLKAAAELWATSMGQLKEMGVAERHGADAAPETALGDATPNGGEPIVKPPP